MATTNPVYQVLATSGNQALLAAGSRVSALANGQLGVFNFHTGLSIDGSVPGDAQDIFIAVGINRTTGGTDAMEDFNQSAGQMIQTKRVKSLTIKPVTLGVNKIVEVTGFKAKCETDYLLKIEFRSRKSYAMNGYSQFSKTFSAYGGCCIQTDDCDTCVTGDSMAVAKGLMDAINADTDALVTASLFANAITATVTGAPTADGTITVVVGSESFAVPILDADTATQVAAKVAAFINTVTTSAYKASSAAAVITVYPKSSVSSPTTTLTLGSAGGTAVTIGASAVANQNVTDTVAFAAANPGVIPSLRITGNTEVRGATTGNINLAYNKLGVDFIVSMTEGLGTCNGTVTTVQALQYAQGSGYDLLQLEDFAGGWNGKPGVYRQQAVTGLQKTDGFERFVVGGTSYTTISMTYDLMSVGGWLEYLNNLETIIAIPCADTTTLGGLAAILLLVTPQFQTMVNDAATFDCDNPTVDVINNPALDGIESLA